MHIYLHYLSSFVKALQFLDTCIQINRISNEMKKAKSKVNAAGNYTKPTTRKALFNKIKAGTKGGDKGEWSARKAQLLASEYKKKGGGYKS